MAVERRRLAGAPRQNRIAMNGFLTGWQDSAVLRPWKLLSPDSSYERRAANDRQRYCRWLGDGYHGVEHEIVHCCAVSVDCADELHGMNAGRWNLQRRPIEIGSSIRRNQYPVDIIRIESQSPDGCKKLINTQRHKVGHCRNGRAARNGESRYDRKGSVISEIAGQCGTPDHIGAAGCVARIHVQHADVRTAWTERNSSRRLILIRQPRRNWDGRTRGVRHPWNIFEVQQDTRWECLCGGAQKKESDDRGNAARSISFEEWCVHGALRAMINC